MSKPKVVKLYGIRQGKKSDPIFFKDGWRECDPYSLCGLMPHVALYSDRKDAVYISNPRLGERVALWGKAVITKTAKE